MEKVLLQGRVGHIYDPVDINGKRKSQGFALIIEVGLLDDNDNVQTEVYTFAVNAFDDVAAQVKAKLRVNDELLIMGTTTENEDLSSKPSKNQIMLQQFRILPKELADDKGSYLNKCTTLNIEQETLNKKLLN